MSSASSGDLSKCVSDTGSGVEDEWIVLTSINGLFANPGKGNLMPGRNSALVDTGTAYSGAENDADLAGNDRIIGSAIDIGCYEQTGEPPTSMYISGYPGEYGTPDPDYGKIDDASASTAYSMDALTFSDNGLEKYHCAGFIMYTNDAQNVWHEEFSSENLSVQYAIQSICDSKLEWQFEREYYVETSSMNSFGTISSSDWYFEGNEATIYATPATGFKVLTWLVNGVMQPEENNTVLKWTVTEPATISVVFVPEDSDGTVQYVSTTGDDSASGYLVDDPKKTIYAAVDMLSITTGSGTVYVAPGVYILERNKAVYITDAISVIGSTGISADVVVTNKYDANYSENNSIFYINHKDALVASLTMTGGQLNQASNPEGDTLGGYNLYIGSKGGTVSNCVISSGGSINPHNPGAVYLCGGDALLTHCIVSNCWNSTQETVGWPAQNGIGITISGGRVESCLVDNCRSTSTTYATEPKSSAIYATGGTIVNTTVVNNQGRCSGGFSVSGSAQIINCAIIGNKNINENDPVASDAWIGTAENYTACLSDTSDPINGNCSATSLPANQIFRTKMGADYFPVQGSPLINRGVNWSGAENTTDLAGNPRKIGSFIDIGCYEGPEESSILFIR
jgi:hypothetical protein